ncbi:hypothetical protein NITGR_420006 [Nitrospina gracilis 3/211]|uniref:Uncharacterized protein n=1 Tax=Nitrospina gracilis (strain 3/211) TaxID=1266370 RepID=M1YZB1_NITG3|nr:hypothetical protein NITGR_420006 [Nitrospina gracilis 3/211]
MEPALPILGKLLGGVLPNTPPGGSVKLVAVERHYLLAVIIKSKLHSKITFFLPACGISFRAI